MFLSQQAFMIVPECAQSTLRSLKGRVFSDLVDDGEKGKERPLKRVCVCVCVCFGSNRLEAYGDLKVMR